jgi:hypothetical protein
MRSGWLNVPVKLALAWRAFLIDVNNFHLLQYRTVAGFLVSGKNSGTHWLRFMLSHALAHRHGLSPPAHSSGRQSEDFVGHPRWPRRHARLPFIGSSHNLPSVAFAWPWVRRLMRLPPIVVLVRDPKEAMLSHFVKWRGALDLSLSDYVLKPSTKRRQLANAWWYIDFFNRWGRMAESAPDEVLVVRYEDLQAAPAHWLSRISTHLRLGLEPADIDAAMAVGSRDAVRATLDPEYGEAIVPDTTARADVRLSGVEDKALSDQFSAHLQYDFGYGHARRPSARAPALGSAIWARAAFLLAAAYVLCDQFGWPDFDLTIAQRWGRIELTGAFALLTVLGPQSFPRLRPAVPAGLLLLGGGVELAQYGGLAPGVASFTDLVAELGGVAAALALMPLIAASGVGRLGGRKALSSHRSSSAARGAAAPPGRHPR